MTGELSPALQLKDFQARLTLNFRADPADAAEPAEPVDGCR